MIIDPRYEPYTSGTGPEPNPRLGYQARPGRSRSRTWRVRVGQSGSLPGPCSTNLDRSLSREDRSRTGRLRVGRSGNSTRGGPGPEPESDPRLSFQARPGRSRSRTWRVRVGQSGSLPGPCSTNLDRSWSLDGEDRSRTGRLRVGQSGSPTHCGPGPEPDLRPSYRTGLGLGRSRTCGHTSVAQTCWDCRQAGGNQQGRGTQSRRSCPMGPDSDGFIMNRLEEGALGDPVLAGNLVSDLDGRLRHS